MTIKVVVKSQGRGRSNSLPIPVVEYLKTWLLSHMEHPYPTDREKAEMCEKTGIDVKRLNNWFVNNRIRYWKPRMEAQQREQQRRSALQKEQQQEERNSSSKSTTSGNSIHQDTSSIAAVSPRSSLTSSTTQKVPFCNTPVSASYVREPIPIAPSISATPVAPVISSVTISRSNSVSNGSPSIVSDHSSQDEDEGEWSDGSTPDHDDTPRKRLRGRYFSPSLFSSNSAKRQRTSLFSKADGDAPTLDEAALLFSFALGTPKNS